MNIPQEHVEEDGRAPVYYGKQTEQALRNFPEMRTRVHPELIRSIALIKKAAAGANFAAGAFSKEVAEAIESACDEILAGAHDDQFVTPAIQGGAGTSINMNVNEVIAALASRKITREVHPNDEVNSSQSTNDVNPTALKITALQLLPQLTQAIDELVGSLQKKAQTYASLKKLARTHLQDALPIYAGEELQAYAATIARDGERIKDSQRYMQEVNLGGTAVGNKINASSVYQEVVYERLRALTGLEVRPAENLMSQTSSQADFLQVSAMIKILFVDLSKMATDLRILSSGPRGGIGEVVLEARQPGSSIMPGKVNPVIPEYINQVYYYLAGKNLTIERAAEGAVLELGIMFPVLADALISSLKIAIDAVRVLKEACIDTLMFDEDRCRDHLERSTAYATLLVPKLGYDKTSDCVKRAVKEGRTVREIVLEECLMDEKEFESITSAAE